MNKLFQFWDNWVLKIGVALIIAFIPLYPKLPSISISHTWVYIRLEDFLISAVVIIWFIQLVRKKVSFPFSLSIPIISYWVIGFLSLIISLIFIGPHLANFFPKVAALQYFRRIEYMVLFFVGFSSIRTKRDMKDYLIVLSCSLVGILLYGFGQRFYLNVWAAFPEFARRFSFCFPSFQTGNEEFAKGIPLCLPADARITSTFGGHYDLAAYLVIITPVLIALTASLQKFWIRILTGILSAGSILLLIFTASRISFAAYLIGTTITLIFLKQKKYILPVFLVSCTLLVLFSSSLEKRFLETIRFTSIVTNNQGQVVGVAPATLPADLQKKIAKNPAIEANVPTQSLPTGSSFITLPVAQTPVTTTVAVVKKSLTQDQAKKLKLANGGIEISTISGNFLVQKALVYDISFTTRFQGEWPNAWAAFMREPLLGSGYSSITLASDNDYLRALGESGFLGLGSFLFIFLILGIYLQRVIPLVKNNTEKAFVFGLAGGVIGLFINASLIDVFESSKVAESLWTLLGIGAGSLSVYYRGSVDYWKGVKKVLFSPILIAFYLLIAVFIIYAASTNNFFVGDDFTWLHWAANATSGSIKEYFLNSSGFFYRPIAKVAMLFLYTFFSFYPQGYHIFIILLQWLMAFGVFILTCQILKKRYLAFLAALLFLILPGRAEDFFWIATLSIVLSSLFVLYSLIFFISSRQQTSLPIRIIAYIGSLICGLLSIFTYEGAVIFPLLFITYDLLFLKGLRWEKTWVRYIPYIMMLIGYFVIRSFSHALSPNGDYSYNIPHLIPNFIGNFFGYILLFVFGQQALPWYAAMRNDFKTFSLIIALLGVFVVFFIIWKTWTKKFLKSLQTKEHLKTIIFCCKFIVIALLPFLGFGNITQRYEYLASVGFVILVLYSSNYVLGKLLPKKNMLCYTVLTSVFVVYGVFALHEITAQNNEWSNAGSITNKTLSYIKVFDDDFTSGSGVSFYFINVPIKYQNAWVFPVGLEDGIWFIYRDPTIHVYQVASEEQAESMSANSPKTSYIFEFDKKGNVVEIDHHNL